MTQGAVSETEIHQKTFRFTVDGEPFSTHEDELTPRQIMTIAKIDPATHFLTQIKGKEQISYEGRTDEEIKLHNEMVFISTTVGSTGVS
jgi:hypothetical protein